MTPEAPATARCERCGNTRAGDRYGFWYGKATTRSTSGEAQTSYTIGGQDSAFICDQCIADRRRRLRRVAIILPSVSFVVLMGMGLGFWLVDGEVGGLVGLGTMAILFGPVLAPVLLWQLNRNPDFGRERTGELYAIAARKKDLRAQGHTHFWDRKQFEAVAASVPRQGAAAGGAASADYSFVRDASGSVTGVWLRDAAQAHNQSLLMALLTKHGESPVVLMGGARVVPNRHDASGGSFVMFGGVRAPGEA